MLKDMKMKQLTTNKSRGLTLTELLAVMMIISLLATIAVPVYVSRQEDARIRVAQGETREIAMAEEAVAVMHGFYVPFQLLDDLPARRDNAVRTDEERIDQYQHLGGIVADSNIFLINPTIPAEDQINNQLTLADGRPGVGGNPRVRRLILDWNGPYINFHRFWYDPSSATYTGPYDDNYRNSIDMFRDFPLDPWGNPYRFYSPIGIIGDGNDHRGDQFNFENPHAQFSNGELTRFDEDRFQRYAVVSYGRDGLSDTDTLLPPNLDPNDIVYEFGTDGVSRNFGRF